MEQDLFRNRKTEFPVDSLFRNRWSPRALSGEELDRSELMSLFEAARWAPSSGNNQPWRFIYATRSSPHWSSLFELLVEGNKIWAKNAAALIVIIAKKTFDNGKPAVTHSFDCGAAWENLALQASIMRLVAHGMEGFDYHKAREVLQVPEDFAVQAMIAVGKPGKKEDLPPKLQEREIPSGRKPISEITFEGKFGGVAK